MFWFLPACAEAMATAKAREAKRRILEAGEVGHEVTLIIEDDTRFPTHWEMDGSSTGLFFTGVTPWRPQTEGGLAWET